LKKFEGPVLNCRDGTHPEKMGDKRRVHDTWGGYLNELVIVEIRNKCVYYESMKRKLLKPINECRCDGRLQTKRITRLPHTGSVVELEQCVCKFPNGLFIINGENESYSQNL
jgi:hypothetical protein